MTATNLLLSSAPVGLQMGSGSASNFVLDETTDRVEYIFQASEAATITELGYLYGARALTPPTYVIQLEGVNLSTGRSDGTIKAAGNAKKTFTPPASTADDGLWKWPGTMTSSYTCTRGEYLAIVITYSSGTVNGTNNSSFTYGFSGGQDTLLPCAWTFNATGAVATHRTTGPSPYGYRSASKTYGLPVQTYIQQAFSSDSTPDEYALCFKVHGSGFTYQIGYIEAYIIPPAAAKSFKAVLYSGTTVLQDVTIDSDTLGNNSSRIPCRIMFDEVTLSTLDAGTVYRIGLQPQETANNMQLTHFQFANSSDMQSWPGNGDWFLSTRTDAGAWTDVATKIPRIDIGITDITGTASGGLIRPSLIGGV